MKSIYIKGSAKSLKKLEELQKTGELSKILGYQVVEVKKSSAKQIKSLQQQGIISPVNTSTKTFTLSWQTIFTPILIASLSLVIGLTLLITQPPDTPAIDQTKGQSSTSKTLTIDKEVNSLQKAQTCYAAFQNNNIQISEKSTDEHYFTFTFEYEPNKHKKIVQILKQCNISISNDLVIKESNITIKLFIE